MYSHKNVPILWKYVQNKGKVVQIIFLNFTGSSLILIFQSTTFPNIYNTLISRHLVKSVQIRSRKNSLFGYFSRNDTHAKYWLVKSFSYEASHPASILFKVNNRINKAKCKICSKLTLKTPEWLHCHLHGVFIVNFKQISHISLVDFK